MKCTTEMMPGVIWALKGGEGLLFWMAWGSQLGMRMRTALTAGRMGDSLEYKGYTHLETKNQKPKTMFPNGMGQQFFS